MEGALPQSLYIQFADRAITGIDLLEQVWMRSKEDIRHRILYRKFSLKVSVPE